MKVLVVKKIYYDKKLAEKDKIIDMYKSELELLKKELDYYKKISCTDSLTKLNNRRAIKNVDEYDSIVLGDIDYFKKINDKYGHDLGDKVLIEISDILKKYTRNTDLVCRWGGEEFVIFLKNCDDEMAYDKALTLKNAVSKLSEKFGFTITMSFGVSNLLGKTMQNALKEADEAMYKSKENGRNRVTVYSLNL